MHNTFTWKFVQSSIICENKIRFLNIVDEYRELFLSIKSGRRSRSENANDTLGELFAMHGAPKLHRSDNWPKFISIAIKDWLTTLDIDVLYTEI